MIYKVQFLHNNECYKRYQHHSVKGILLHSTGANNPYLKRYVQPNDGILGENKNRNSWNTYRPDNQQKCVHAFIGKTSCGDIAIYQTLPWDLVGWHSGSGKKGSANYKGYVGIEMCEDGLTDSKYLMQCYTAAAELCADLCEQYKIDPYGDGTIMSHNEAARKGIASWHVDCDHWLKRFGLTMTDFRRDVQRILQNRGKSK